MRSTARLTSTTPPPSSRAKANTARYGTGGSPLVSDDGWTWRRGVTPARTGAAPDVIHIGDRYFMYISGVTMISSKTLNPDSPDYKWEDGGSIAGYEGEADFLNPIDPGAFLDPTDGRLWLTYGSYVGYLRLVQLDPKTGKRVDRTFHNLAINCEASDMIYHDGWYYPLATHGSCCAGANSGYNIRVGRSKSMYGPYLDNMGVDMLQGGGKQLIGSGGRSLAPAISALWNLAKACRSSPCTGKPTWTGAAPACWISARCCGKTAGLWPARI